MFAWLFAAASFGCTKITSVVNLYRLGKLLSMYTCAHTYGHAHIHPRIHAHTRTFCKAISVNLACAKGYGNVPDLKIICFYIDSFMQPYFLYLVWKLSSYRNLVNVLQQLSLSTIMLQLKQIFEQAFKKRKDIQEALTHFGLNAKKIAKVRKHWWLIM